jgi:hypothetical protein
MALYCEILCLYIVYKLNGISLDSNLENRAVASVRVHTIVLRTDETKTVVLYVCVTMSQEDMILSHESNYVCVVSLITKLFCELKVF